MRCFSLAILLAASVAWSADPPKFSTPEADFPSDDLRGPGPDDKTYPLTQDAAKSKDLRAKRLAWYREQIVVPFDTGEGAKGKGAAEAKKALETTAEYFAASRGSPWVSTFTDPRDAALKAAVKAGSEDSIVQLFHTVFAAPAEIALENAENLAEIGKDLEKRKAPIMLRVVCSREQANWMVKAGESKPSLRKEARKLMEQCIKLTAELAKTADANAEKMAFIVSRGILRQYRTAGWGLENGFEFMNETYNTAGLSESFIKCIEGQYYIDFANDARGTGPTANVTDEQWADMKSRLKSAETALTVAWKADEKFAITPTLMISVCKGLATKRSTMETWFDRAMTLDPDNIDACRQKISYLSPQAQGSAAELFIFGRQCMRTKNFDAGLPLMLVEAHRVVSAGRLASHCTTHDAAWADVREVFEHALQWKPADREILSEYALLCEAVGQPKAAQQHLKSLNGKFFTPTFKNKADFDAAVKRIDAKVKEKEKK